MSLNSDLDVAQAVEDRSDDEKKFLSTYHLVLSVIAFLLLIDGIVITIAVWRKLRKVVMFASLLMLACYTTVFGLNIFYLISFGRFAQFLLDLIGYAFTLYLFVVLWSYYKGEPQADTVVEEEDVNKV